MSAATARIAVFCKAPIPGYAKTRLIPRLGAQSAAHLHAELAERTLTNAIDAGIGTVELWCAPNTDHAFFMHCRDVFHVPLVAQPPGDLSTRLRDYFALALGQVSRAVVIGTDCPGLNVEYLRDAAHALSTGHDAVIGPASDGGYVLLGLRRCPPGFFDSIPWSTANVLAKTRERLRAMHYRWHELAPRLDIDTPEDLDNWPAAAI